MWRHRRWLGRAQAIPPPNPNLRPLCLSPPTNRQTTLCTLRILKVRNISGEEKKGKILTLRKAFDRKRNPILTLHARENLKFWAQLYCLGLLRSWCPVTMEERPNRLHDIFFMFLRNRSLTIRDIATLSRASDLKKIDLALRKRQLLLTLRNLRRISLIFDVTLRKFSP